MMAITKEELQSMRTAGYLIEPPAGDVINNLADEIDRLCTRIADLEAKLAIMTGIIDSMIKKLER
jgi:prefoldin subunit 5